MKKLLGKGKALVAFVSVFAILAVSMLSMFTGINFTATASKAGTDSDVWAAVDGSWYDTELAGAGTATDPYLITSCEELAAVVTGAITTTEGLYFKVADGIGSFYMNGGEALASLTSAAEVKEWFDANGSSCRIWWSKGIFMGNFDGNGATVYGLYTGEAQQAAFGLFHQVDGATIKNIAVKNFCSTSNEGSSFTGGIFGNSKWGTGKTTTIENCTVENCYLATSKTYSGVIGGHAAGNTVNIKNCYVAGNTVIDAYNTVDEKLIGYGDAAVNVDGIVAIGDAAVSSAATVSQSNVYTDVTLTREYNGVTTVSSVTGAAAIEAMPALDWDFTWFANDGAPMLRAFHNFTGTSIGVDGHTEKTACCDVAGVITTKHIYTTVSACNTCGYTFPCSTGHTFEYVEAVEATEEHAGNIAYQHCTVCDKNFAADAEITAPVDTALTQEQIIIPQILPYDMWDGGWDDYFWMNNEGDGSPANPFIISTAEQLASVAIARLKYDASKEASAEFDISKYTITNGALDTTGLFFKVKNGIEAFYMNGEQAIAELESAAEVKEYFENNVPATNWWVGGVFKGNFNGNGATVYGLYANKEYAGLFPILGPDVVIKNISVKNSYFAASNAQDISQAFTGGLFGQVEWYKGISSAASVTVRNSSVINCYLESNNHTVNSSGEDVYVDAGAIGGHIRELKLKLKNCLIYGNEIVNVSGNMGGIIGEGWNVTDEIVDSVFIGTAPFSVNADKSRAKGESFTNVYTDADLTEGEALAAKYYGKETFEYAENQIKQIEASQIIGDAAKTTMASLDWEKLWQTNADSYPTPRLLSIKDYAPGYVWSGEVAEEFPAGEGSKSNPYKINTPEYLALMLNMDNDGVYYELTADITINDTTAENWTDSAKQWYTSNDVPVFKGTLNGNGYTVSGLYISEVPADTYAGLIPVADSATINNLTVADSYISGNADSTVAAIIGGIVDNSAKPIYMQGNTVESDVTISGTGVSGGIVGECGNSILRIGNSISKAVITSTDATGGIVAVTDGGVSVKNSVSVNTAPFGSADAVVATNVYTDVTGTVVVSGVTRLETSELQGENAKTNTALDFETIWTTVADDYPALAGAIDTANGTVGDIWTGDIATAYAGGSGTEEDPYLIATGEQLALCVTGNGDGRHYKLTADIYLNDVNSPLWEDKIGCNEWFNSKTGSKWASLKNGSFDGDGYVIYGLYYNRAHYENNSAFNGLFATVTEGAVIKNVGISNAYMAGSTYNGSNFNEFMGALVGYVIDWDGVDWDDDSSNGAELPSNDAFASKEITSDPEYQARMPKIINCFVDHNSYLSGGCVGGIIGAAHGAFKVENCIFTGSLAGKEKSNTAGLIGHDMGYGGYWYDCVSFPQTCDRPLGGSANADWRTTASVWPTTAEDVYYFSMYRVYNTVTKISKPTQRVGTAAQEAMPGLDWEGITDDGTEDIWRVVENGTPLQVIFAQKHTEEEFISFSDRSFLAPEVTVNLITGTTEVQLETDTLTGAMYSKMELPTPTRAGYVFTGWYPHANLSVEYPYDYFPPRSLNLYAGWEAVGVICNFENYTDTIWDYDDDRWILNKPGARGGYKNAYVRNGSKSMHLLDTSAESADVLLNYEDMLEVGKTYTMTFWVTTDRADNPSTKLSLIHNSKPVYRKTGIAMEDMVVVEGLTVGEWTQYTYTFTAQTKWVSIRATGNSSLYFDDIIIAPSDSAVSGGNLVYLSTSGSGADSSSTAPNTADNTVSVAVLISAIMSCAVVVVISRKNLNEIIE